MPLLTGKMNDLDESEIGSQKFWDNLFKIGFSELLYNQSSDFSSIWKELSSDIECILPMLDEALQHNYIYHLYSNNKEAFEDVWLKNYILRNVNEFNAMDRIPFNHADFYSLIIKIAKEILDVKIDDISVFITYSSSGLFNTKLAQEIFGKILQSDELLLKLISSQDIKLFPKETRSQIYSSAIEKGILTKKIARRIRSDASGRASSDLLKKIFFFRTKYEQELFKDIILQFCDTKHRWAAQFIALNMPKEYLSFLLGLEDESAKRIIEKRMILK